MQGFFSSPPRGKVVFLTCLEERWPFVGGVEGSAHKGMTLQAQNGENNQGENHATAKSWFHSPIGAKCLVFLIHLLQ